MTKLEEEEEEEEEMIVINLWCALGNTTNYHQRQINSVNICFIHQGIKLDSMSPSNLALTQALLFNQYTMVKTSHSLLWCMKQITVSKDSLKFR